MPKSTKSGARPKIKNTHTLQWVLEPLESRPDFYPKRMFGCLAGYLDERLVIVLADSGDPWNGVLIPTLREHHATIQQELSGVRHHPVLGKWLYLPLDHPQFEEFATQIVELILRGDPRFGVLPKPKKIKSTRRS